MSNAVWTAIEAGLGILFLLSIRPLVLRYADRHRARREGRRG